VLWELVRSGLSPATRRATVDAFDAVLGLDLAEWRADEALVPMDIAALAEERRRARAARDWTEADALRERLRTRGWVIEDREQGQRLVQSPGKPGLPAESE
jgi:cysteinyl-tRNA synthetase